MSLSKKYSKIAVIAAFHNKIANEKKARLIEKFGFCDFDKGDAKIEDFDLMIVLGGDGLMLHLLHRYEKIDVPFYGVNCGTIGFLMNDPDEEKLIAVIDRAHESRIFPLQMTVIDVDGKQHDHIAINEVSLLRQSSQAAKISVSINGKNRVESLAGDGVLVASPAGSTAYNLSCGGPIIPLDSKLLVLTPISPFRPRNFRGAILPSSAIVEFKISHPNKRPVTATADFIDVKNVERVVVKEQKILSFRVLFDADHSLEERIIREQFRGS